MGTSEKILINAVDLPRGATPESRLDFLDKYGIKWEISDKPDFIIYEPFGNEHLKYDCVRIYRIGENERPDFNICDYAIGFDYMDFGDRYLRKPLYRGYQAVWKIAMNRPGSGGGYSAV